MSPPHEPEAVPVVQEGEHEGALHRLRHVPQAGRREAPLLLDELDRHVAVGLDAGLWQLPLPPQSGVIVQDPIVGQGESGAGHASGEGVVVAVISGVPLGGQPGVAHDYMSVLRDKEVQIVGGAWAFEDMEPAVGIAGNTGGVSAPDLALRRQGADQLASLPAGQPAAAVDQSEETAHYCSTPPSTGSLM